MNLGLPNGPGQEKRKTLPPSPHYLAHSPMIRELSWEVGDVVVNSTKTEVSVGTKSLTSWGSAVITIIGQKEVSAGIAKSSHIY